MGRIITRQDSNVLVIRVDGREHSVTFQTSRPLRQSGEAQALVAAPAAMRLGIDIEVGDPVAPGFGKSFHQAQQLLASWFPADFRPVRLIADEHPIPADSVRASFFSGGVDSYYTAIERSGQIDYLILVYGFDIRYQDDALRSKVAAEITSAANDLGKDLVEIKTDLRLFTNTYMDWGLHYHGMGWRR